MIEVLKKSNLFTDYLPEELDLISPFLLRRQLKSGEYLIRENIPAQALFIIESGQVEILKRNYIGQDFYIGKVAAGSIIGELAFLDNLKRSACVVADGDLTVLELPFEAIEKLSRQNQNLGLRLNLTISVSLIEKLKQTTSDLAELVSSARLIALGAMAADIAHEINHPLTNINLLTHQIAKEMENKDLNQALIKENTGRIQDLLLHVSQTISGIKKVSSDTHNDPLSENNIRKIIEETVLLCQGKLNDSHIQLQLSFLNDEMMLRCRPVQISQVLLNLIHNACDAISSLPEKWVQIEAKVFKNYTEISVTDSGSGIPSHLIKNIFQPFFTTKNPSAGTGIGLSISKKIIEAHQGKLFVDSESKNTRFVIQLPNLSIY